jgi:UDP-glucose 4-epimerase
MGKKKILVTGGTGYIGSHTTVELINAGFDVLIIDNLSNSSIEMLDRIKNITGIRPDFVKIDMRNKSELHNFFQEHTDIVACIHFAAFKAVGESHEKPLKYYDNNLKSLLNLLSQFSENKEMNLVFSSSCTVYGNPDKLPVSENSPIKTAMSPYGNTKRISEEILHDYTKGQKNFNCTCLRYFNPIGAHSSGEIGELPDGIPNNLMPFITQTALGIRKELSIFGKDYDTPDGTCIRDYINVVDLAKAHVVSIERLLNNKNKSNFEYFNIGTGKGVSVMDMVNSFERVTGVKLNYCFAERRTGDVPVVYADTTKANNELHWHAEKSLDETISSAWKWETNYRKNL